MVLYCLYWDKYHKDKIAEIIKIEATFNERRFVYTWDWDVKSNISPRINDGMFGAKNVSLDRKQYYIIDKSIPLVKAGFEKQREYYIKKCESMAQQWKDIKVVYKQAG